VVGSDLAGHAVTASVTGLLAGSRYRVRIVATSPAGATVAAASTFTTAKAAGPAAGVPVLSQTIDADPAGGLVYVRLAGIGRQVTPLSSARELPVDATFDTRLGAVRLTVAAGAGGKLKSGEFSGGEFTFFQALGKAQQTVLALVRPSTLAATCAAAAGKTQPKLASLRASVDGSFEVRGRESAAIGGDGAVWTTTDRCDGTLTTVADGVVKVHDFARRRTVVVAAGHGYLAKPA
jgi:hypothetical protein